VDVKVQLSSFVMQEGSMISPTAEYALRAVVALGQQRGEPLTTPRIAELTRVPAGYLAKVLQTLGRAGLVTSRRGLGGGFVLSRPADQMSVLEVVNAVDPIARIESCPLKIPGHGANLCPLHHRLDEAIATVERSFGETMIADLLTEAGRSSPLCSTEAKPVSVSVGGLKKH
jgi:Rrf2 family protein